MNGIEVYKAINAVQSEMAAHGISKERKNQQQGYSFRGIDDVYNALSPMLARHGLCILPRMIARQCVERQSAKGGVLFYVTVEAEFDFISSSDGSRHTIKTFGEAMDSGDKATNKAMSAAYKYAAFQTFAIPTEADNDADAHTHEVKGGMDIGDIANHLAAIESCSDIDQLRTAREQAIAAARLAGDQKAAASFDAEARKVKAKLEAA